MLEDETKMSKTLLVIPVLLVLLVVPTTVFAQTDFGATSDLTVGGFESFPDIVMTPPPSTPLNEYTFPPPQEIEITTPITGLQELPHGIETLTYEKFQDGFTWELDEDGFLYQQWDELGTNPEPKPEYPQVTETYTIEQNEDGTFTYSTHIPYISDGYDWKPYVLGQDENVVQVQVAGGTMVFDKVAGAVTMFNDYETVIDSDSYIVRTALIGSDVWTNLDVNNADVETTVVEDGEKVTVSFIRENDEGKFTTEYVIYSGKIKTTAYFTNYIYDNNKFAFTQTLNLPDSIITLNEMESIDLTDYVGQSFPREVLEQNEDLILNIKDMYYSSGLGFDNLWSVNVTTPTIISLDYANVEQTQTDIGDTVELDPTLGIGTTTGWIRSVGVTSTPTQNCAVASDSKIYYLRNYNSYPSYNGCRAPIAEFDVSSIPNDATVTSVNVNYEIDWVSGASNGMNAVDWNDISIKDHTTTMIGWDDATNASSGQSYVTNETGGNGSAGDVVNVNLGTLGNTNVQNQLNSSTSVDGVADWFSVGFPFSNTTQQSYVRDVGYKNVGISVVYTLPPSTPTNVTATANGSNVDLSWSASDNYSDYTVSSIAKNNYGTGIALPATWVTWQGGASPTTPTMGVGGVIGTAFDFNGSTDVIGDNYVTGYPNSGVQPPQGSISVWIKPEATSASAGNPIGGTGLGSYWIQNGQWSSYYPTNSFNIGSLYSNANAYNMNQWNHLVATVDSSGGGTLVGTCPFSGGCANIWTIYMNGSPVQMYSYPSGTGGGTAINGSPQSAGNLLANLVLGGQFHPNPQLKYPFDGKIDEFSSWNRVLTQSEVTTLYNSGNGNTPDVIPSNLNLASDTSHTQYTLASSTGTSCDETYVSKTSSYTLVSGGQQSSLYCTYLLMGYDVSSIPDNATITDVVFEHSADGNAGGTFNKVITPITKNPATATDQEMATDIGDGTPYATVTTAMPYYDNIVDLGTSADSNLSALVASGDNTWYFGVKPETRPNNNTNNNYVFFGSYESKLTISYTANGVNNNLITYFPLDNTSAPLPNMAVVTDPLSVTYDVKRDGTSIGTTTNTSFTDNTTAYSTPYLFSLTSSTSNGTSPPATNIPITLTIPAPTNLSATLNIPNVDLSWTGGTGATGYKIEHSTDGTNWSTLVADTGNTNTTYSDTVPTPNTVNHYQVRTLIGSAESNASSSASATVGGVPDTPTGLTATFNTTTADMDLAFTAPANNGSAIVGYKVEVSTDNANWSIVTADTGNTNTTYTDLNPTMGSLNYYKVSAINAYGISLTSNVDNDMAGVPPDAPTITSTSTANPNTAPLEITVNWTAPTNTGTAGITNYEVYRDGTLVTTVGNVTSYTDTVPTGGGTFVYSLKSVTPHGTSVLSATASHTTPTVPPAPTSAPTLAIANPDSNPFDITLSWSLPSSGGSAITSFEVFRSTDDITYTSVGNTSQLIFYDTVPNVGTFYYKFASINLVGNSVQSPSSNIATPTEPVADSSVTLAINSPDPSPLDITISIVAPSGNGGSAITGYNLHSSSDDITYTQVATNVTTDQTVTVSSAGTWYIKSQAINNAGTAVLGSATSITTPSVPTGDASVTLAIPDPDGFPFNSTATFVAPSGTGGSAITGYNLFYSDDDITYSQIATASNSVISQTLTGAGTHYFKVESINNVGTSAPSSAITIDTPTVPTAPQNAGSTIADIDNAPYEVTVTWETPSSTGGSDLTQYNVYRKQGSSAYSLLTTTTGLSITDTVPTSLTTNFTYKIHSVNNVGESTAFDDTTITTFNVPSAPTLSVTTGTTVLSWNTPASDATVSSYKIYRDNVLLTTVGTVTTYSDFSTIVFGNSYDFKIVAVSSLGDSADSNTVTTTPETEITGMVARGVTGTGAVIDWDEPAYYQGQVTSYNVYYGNSGTPATSAGTTTNTFSNFAPQLDYDTTYVFGVSINSPLGNSGLSNIVAITTNVDTSIVSADPTTGGAGWFDIDSVNNQSVNVIEFQRETQMISGNLTDTLQVAYPTWWDDMTCDVDYKFAQKTEQYVEGDDMTAQVNSANADQQVIGFQFQEVDNEVIEVQCAPQQSTQDDGVSAKYVMTQNNLGAVGEVGTPNIPIVAQITNFSNGTYGTDGDFGALNIVGLFAILISMVGFNRLNPIVGVLLSASMIFVLSWFGIITIPTAIIGAIALVIFLAWGATRNR